MAKLLKKPKTKTVIILISETTGHSKSFKVGRGGVTDIRNFSSNVPSVNVVFKNGRTQEYIGYKFSIIQ